MTTKTTTKSKVSPGTTPLNKINHKTSSATKSKNSKPLKMSSSALLKICSKSSTLKITKIKRMTFL